MNIAKLVKVSCRQLFAACSLLGWILLFRNILYGTNHEQPRDKDRMTQVINPPGLKPIVEPISNTTNTTATKYHIVPQIHTNTSRIKVTISILQKRVFLYSAIAMNSTTGANTFWNNIVLSGWEHPSLSSTNYTCCIVYGKFSRGATPRPFLTKRNWSYVGRAKLDAKQWLCPNAKHELPTYITLSAKKVCPYSEGAYVKVEPAFKKPKGYFAVCAKVVYGAIKGSRLIEWFEFQRLMNVSVIMLYTNSLNANATRVLEYYRSIGLVEFVPFELGGVEIYPRQASVKNFQGWNDEQVTVFDCQSRLSGATYLALYDLDEFIYPFKHTEYAHLMDHLTSTYPRAAGFTFKSEIYVSSWDQNSNQSTSNLMLSAYTKRTEVMKDRVKNFIRVDRLEPGRMSTHGFWSKKNYKKVVVPDSVAVIKHYRTCRKEWMRRGGEKCFKTIQQIDDTSMLPVAKILEPRVNNVRNILGL